MHRRSIRFLRAAAAALVVSSAAGPSSWGAADLSLAPIERELGGMAAQIHNAGIRLKLNLAGMRAESADNSPDTPGKLCCSSNIGHIENHIKSLTTTMTALDEAYNQEQRQDGAQVIAGMRQELARFTQALHAFGNATKRDQTHRALGLVKQSFGTLREGSAALHVCCAPPEPPAVPLKKKKSGSRASKKKGTTAEE